jgi:hypothetical protein
MVLEVAGGTQVQVTPQADGIAILLQPGHGAVKADLVPGPRTQAAASLASAPAAKEGAPASVPDLPLPALALMSAPVLPAEAVVPPAPAEAEAQPQAAPAQAQPPAPSRPLPAAQPPVLPAPVHVAAAPRAPLAPMPVVGMPFQTLPKLTLGALLPATPGAGAEKAAPAPAAPVARREELRGGRTLGDVGPKYTGTPMTIDVAN